MAFNFRTRTKIAKGTYLNTSKHGTSISRRKKGFGYTIGSNDLKLGNLGKKITEKKNLSLIDEEAKRIEHLISFHKESIKALEKKEDPFKDLMNFINIQRYDLFDDKKKAILVVLPKKDLMPSSHHTLTKTKKLSKKEYTKTQINNFYRAFLASLSFRLARDIFYLTQVQEIDLVIRDMILDPRTGNDMEKPILYVKFERSVFLNLNLERIDPILGIENFEHKVKFSERFSFSPINLDIDSYKE